MMMNEYSHKEIELAAQSEWEKRNLFSTVEDGPKSVSYTHLRAHETS